MKKRIFTLIIGFVFFITVNQGIAQITTPQPSPVATLEQTVGLTKITVAYSRPGVKKRQVFGDLESYGKIWRTGANASTKITFEDAVTLAGNTVPAGQYALYTIPGEKEWTIIVHKNLELWGAGGYDMKDDLVRFKVSPTNLKDNIESFTIDFSNFTINGAHLELKWQHTLVSIPITVDVDAKVMAQIKEHVIDSETVDAKLYAPAASYYLQAGKDLDQALVWIDKAIENNDQAFWLIHTKAKILAGLGKKKEAIKTAQKSMEVAKASPRGDFGYVKNNEEFIAKLKKKK